MSVFIRKHLLTYIAVPQLACLTQEEVEERFECPIPSRFWSEARHRTLSPVDNADMIPALIAAAEGPDASILKCLLDTPGTDTSFWTSNPQPRSIPVPETPSSLGISSPLHAAVRGRNLPALTLLLSRGFNPNLLPLAAPVLKEKRSRAFHPENQTHPSRFSARPTREAVQDCQRRQVEVVRYLFENCKTLDIAAKDIHGNTALHYLASYRNINEELLDLLWQEDYAEEAWRANKNRYGFTAAELFRSGFNVVEDEKDFWRGLDGWEAKQEEERDIWEQKFRVAGHEAVERGVLH
ncbi:MAG: hypothetical protein Q9168_003853 [Polycauliona sp. 1 TL-2023]